MKINILDFQVANMIAAGEVVDRPASVVKELIENAVDAGAKEITCEIRRGGVSFIRVTDNGCGMTREDAEICILRHATSKIKEAKDLDAIVTLGFRGEALAAISSVSLMSIRTRTASEAVGTEIACDFGRITEVNDAGCAKGTTVIVKELFSNVPARRKFLKRDQYEGMACAAVIEKEALGHPEISFKFISDGALRLSTAGDKKLYNAIYALLGREFASKLIKVRSKTEAVEVFGFIGRPDNAKTNRNFQNFFINGRYIKSRTATAALEQAFSSFMESEKFPVCVLNVVLHPALVDVNVHPTKLEVKFSNEKTVFDAVYLAVRNALLTDVTRPEIQVEKKDIDRSATEVYNRFTPVYDRMDPPSGGQTSLIGGKEEQPEEENVKKEADTKSVPQKPYDDLPFIFEDAARRAETENKDSTETKAPETEEKRSFSETVGEAETPVQTKETPDGKEKTEEPSYKILGVAFETYILVEVGQKLLMIDKHAAHERLLFEKMKENVARADKRFIQMLLFPESLKVSYGECAAALEYKNELEAAGYEYNVRESECTVELSGIPAQLDGGTAVDLFTSILSGLAGGETDVEVSRGIFFEKALYTASCKAAMKGGRHDGEEHVDFLVKELLRIPDIRYCPHGRPVIYEIPKGTIDYKFGRT